MTSLFITVDAEVCAYDPTRDNPDTQIWGKTLDGMAYGIGFIMDELTARGWSCTFFLNVYDTNLWGEESIAAIARTISERGFDVQLHTHVENGISSYSFDEQCRILKEGADRLEKWTGVRPIWHRAGNLCANLDTLRACESEGFIGDSSYLYGWPQCANLGQCSPALCADSAVPRSQIGATSNAGDRNLLRRFGGILELPITTFRTLPLLHNYRHLDIDACTYLDLITIVRQAVRQGMPNVVLLLHSFSFVSRTDGGYVANLENIIKFQRFLSSLKKVNDVGFTTFNSIDGRTSGGYNSRAGATSPAQKFTGAAGNVVPALLEGNTRQASFCPDLSSGLLLTYHRAWSHWGRSWKHKVLALAPLIVLVIILVLCTLALRGRGLG